MNTYIGEGLATLEDVVETLIGLEITDESHGVKICRIWRINVGERMETIGIDPNSLDPNHPVTRIDHFPHGITPFTARPNTASYYDGRIRPPNQMT